MGKWVALPPLLFLLLAGCKGQSKCDDTRDLLDSLHLSYETWADSSWALKTMAETEARYHRTVQTLIDEHDQSLKCLNKWIDNDSTTLSDPMRPHREVRNSQFDPFSEKQYQITEYEFIKLCKYSFFERKRDTLLSVEEAPFLVEKYTYR